jgi:5-methylcytosine-specific restriction endonuclease McrA
MAKVLKNEILKLRKLGKTYSEICDKLNCTKSVVSYHCKNNGLDALGKYNKPDENEIVEFQKIYDETNSADKVAKLTGWSKPTILRYIETKPKKAMSQDEFKKRRTQQVVNWRKRTKIKLVEYKGGKCEKCTYDKCIDALEFHHKNPEQKDFIISGKSWSFEKLKKEVDKCMLVCSNCHKEIHAKINLGL